MRCHSCSFDNPAGSIYCQQCGTRLQGGAPVPVAAHAVGPDAHASQAASPGGPPRNQPPDEPVLGAAPDTWDSPSEVRCSRCGTTNQPNMRFCVECGNPLAQPSPAAPKKSEPSLAGPNAQETPQERAPRTMLEAPAAGVSAQLVAILKDGSDGRTFPLASDQVDVGRTEGDIVLPDDPYLSPRHARLAHRPEGWFLRDLDSVNGIFVRIREPVDLADGDMLLIGQQVLRFETLSDGELPLGPASLNGTLVFGTPEVPRIVRLVQYTTEGVGRDVHYLYRDETVLGRENGDIVFTDDPFLSRRHAAITIDRGARRFVLRDLGSSNGTAIRFAGERKLANGDQFRVGRHLFRFDAKGGPR